MGWWWGGGQQSWHMLIWDSNFGCVVDLWMAEGRDSLKRPCSMEDIHHHAFKD